jgi:site-specific recombinase XerC
LETVREFFRWKERWGEPCGGDDPLLCGPGGRRLSKRTLQAMVTRAFAAADVQGHRTHDLRHSYACHLLRASGHNLRLVQKQLGHASIRTTEVYADIFDPDADRAVEGVSASMNEFQLSENS